MLLKSKSSGEKNILSSKKGSCFHYKLRKQLKIGSVRAGLTSPINSTHKCLSALAKPSKSSGTGHQELLSSACGVSPVEADRKAGENDWKRGG